MKLTLESYDLICNIMQLELEQREARAEDTSDIDKAFQELDAIGTY